jgi:hypothetical protein
MNGLQYALDLIDRSFSNGISRARNETRGLDNAVNTANSGIGRLRNTGQSTFSSLAQYAKSAGIAILAACLWVRSSASEKKSPDYFQIRGNGKCHCLCLRTAGGKKHGVS